MCSDTGMQIRLESCSPYQGTQYVHMFLAPWHSECTLLFLNNFNEDINVLVTRKNYSSL